MPQTLPQANPPLPLLGMISRALRPLPSLTITEWGERYRVLPEDESEPGPWRVRRVPWMRKILDTLSPEHPAQDIVFMKPNQVGATEGGVIWTGYAIHYSPGRFLHIQPTVDMAKRQSRTRYAKMIDSTPELKSLVAVPRSRDGGNTILAKEYPGGILVITGANSAVGLRSLAAPYIHLDEVDAYPQDVDGEGDPITLATRRSQTFVYRRKHFYSSTPLDEATSRIEPLYRASDQEQWEVPCPKCATAQVLLFRHPETNDRLVVWDLDRPETARYLCQQCEAPWTDIDKQRQQEYGQWRALKPWHLPMPVGFWLNALNSLWVTWGELANEYVKARHDPPKLKVFVNTYLAQTWKEGALTDIDIDALLTRCETYDADVPRGVELLTAGVDVQDDRLECQVVGWGPGEECWSLSYHVLMGDPSGFAVWDDLFQVLSVSLQGLEKVWYIQAVCIDTGGHYTKSVYDFTRKHEQRRIWAIKGSSDDKSPLWPVRATRKTIGSAALYMVNTGAIKETLYARLSQQPPGPATLHFPRGYDADYFRQLTGERLKKSYTVKGVKKEWVLKRNARNEVLDTMVYNYAALHGLYARRFRLSEPVLNEKDTVAATDDEQAVEPTDAHAVPPAPQPPASAQRQPRRVVRSHFMRR